MHLCGESWLVTMFWISVFVLWWTRNARNARDDIERRARRWHLAHSLLSILASSSKGSHVLKAWVSFICHTESYITLLQTSMSCSKCMPRVKAAESCLLSAKQCEAMLSAKQMWKDLEPSWETVTVQALVVWPQIGSCMPCMPCMPCCCGKLSGSERIRTGHFFMKRWSHIHNSSCMLRLQFQGLSKGVWKSCSWATLVFSITPDQRKACLTMPYSDYSNYLTIQISIIHPLKRHKNTRDAHQRPRLQLSTMSALCRCNSWWS